MFNVQCWSSLTQYINQHFYYFSNKLVEATASQNCSTINWFDAESNKNIPNLICMKTLAKIFKHSEGYHCNVTNDFFVSRILQLQVKISQIHFALLDTFRYEKAPNWSNNKIVYAGRYFSGLAKYPFRINRKRSSCFYVNFWTSSFYPLSCHTCYWKTGRGRSLKISPTNKTHKNLILHHPHRSQNIISTHRIDTTH
jgi:hypothetical protein